MSVDSTLFLYAFGVGGGEGGATKEVVGGPGGDGLVQSGESSVLTRNDAALVGGSGGDSQWFADGPDGVAETILGGATSQVGLPTYAQDVWAASPVREGDPMSITATGFNDLAWVMMSLNTGHIPLPAFDGMFTLGAPLLLNLTYLGPVPLISQTFPLGPAPQLPAGLAVLEIHMQGVVKSASGGPFMLATPDHIVLLDSAY